MRKFLCLMGFLSLLLVSSCNKDESNPVTPGGSSGTYGGNWTVDNVQLVSAPTGSSASAIMKQALVPFGSISGSFAGYLNITFGAETMSQTSTGLSGLIYGMKFFDNVGFQITSSSSAILKKSTDAGVTWTNIPSPANFNSFNPNLCVYNSSTLYLLLDSNFSSKRLLYKSTNSGTNWTLINSNTGIRTSFGYGTNNVINFVSESVGYAIGSDNISNPALYKTINGGLNWTTVAGVQYEGPIYFSDEMNGYQIRYPNTFAKTMDGGLTWNTTIISSAFEVYSSSFMIGSTIYVSGAEAGSTALYKSQNAGNTWAKIGTNAPVALTFKTESEGYGVVSGIPVKTVNSGLNWMPFAAPANSKMNQLFLINNSPAYFNTSGTMFKPTGTVDSTKWVSAGKITNSALKIITNAPDYDAYANGDFSINGSNIVFTSSNYSQGNDVAAGSGTYAFDGGNLSITLNLANGESWKIRLRRN